MNTEWSLEVLYKGYDDPKFLQDLESLDQKKEAVLTAIQQVSQDAFAEGLKQMLLKVEDLNITLMRLYNYISLKQSVDTMDVDTNRYMGILERKLADLSEVDTLQSKLIAGIDCLEQVIDSDSFLQEYRFMLLSIKDDAKHLFSNEVERMISKMKLGGGLAWEKLYSMTTSTMKVNYKEEEITLPQARNLAYDKDAAVRKEAYEAELKAYPSVALSMAFCVNQIKSQMKMLVTERGYESPLSYALKANHMKKETLDAMFSAIDKYLPVFVRYLKAKSKALGHEAGLPWYDLYAPMGGSKEYTIEETKDLLVNTFRTFSDDMADMMETAFEDEWIDFYPRAGKVGGAFCEYLTEAKQSRILTNFSGDFISIDILAHELGHAYHGLQLAENRPLSTNCPMQLAETASILNETHLILSMLNKVEEKEQIALLESILSTTTQVVCDIYSRFLFEKEVFERCDKEFLMPEDLCNIMLEAQKKSYGEGLDWNYLHPYMWLCKSHYYTADYSFYNYPYAFGALFAIGLYGMFEEEGSAFIPKYRELLKATAKMETEDVALTVGVDLTKPAFWEKSLKVINEMVEKYEELV